MTHTPEASAQQPARVGSLLATGLALVAGLMRLVPHPWNLSPLGSMGIFGGARLRSWSVLLPFGVLVITDLILRQTRGLPPFDPFVYLSFAVYFLLGGLLLRRSQSLPRIGAICFLGALQFFLLTNFGNWLMFSVSPDQLPAGEAVVWLDKGWDFPSPVYARNFAGLIACYIAALPYAVGTFVGDMVFGPFLFVTHVWLTRQTLVTNLLAPTTRS